MQFKNIIGQQKIKESLIQTVKENRVSHAQLFVEQPGSGALPLAISYAQYLCCENKTDIDSCGSCHSCIKYEKLAHPDLHFFYPVATTSKITQNPTSKDFLNEWRHFILNTPYASLFDWLKSLDIENKQGNISKKDGLEIINSLALKSFESPYKVCIIWMVEKLHPSTANGLLKILEEPPEKTLFVLINQDYESLLPTIISRTQLVRLEKIRTKEIVKELTENHNIDPKTAQQYAKLSNGNFAHVTEMLTVEHNEEELLVKFREWMLLCFNKNVAGINNWVDEISRIGRVRQINFLNFAMEVFRKAIIKNFENLDIIPLLEHENAFLSKFSNFVHQNNAIQIIEEFDLAIKHIERNVNAKIVFMDLSLKVLQLLIKKVNQLAK